MQGVLSRAAFLVFGLALLAPATWNGLPRSAAAKPQKKQNSDEEKRQSGEDPDLRDKAKQLVQQGTLALAAHDPGVAEQALSAAYRLSPTPGTLGLLGQLAAAQGRTVQAQDLMRRYLHDLTEPEQSLATKEAQRILAQPGPPSGEVSVVGDPNAVVVVDDHVVGMLPLPLPLLLPVGEHRVALERDALHLEDQVTVKAGRMAEVRCQFHPGVLVVSLSPALLLLTSHPALVGAPMQRIEQEVRQAAALANLALLKRKEALVQAPTLADCLDTVRCQLDLATENLLEHVLTVTAVVRTGTAADWQLKSVLLNATVGEVAAEQQTECLACSTDRAAESLAQLAAAVLKAGLRRPRGTVEIESTPLGAEVTLGARLAGVTPLRRTQWAGPLMLTIRHPGFQSQNLSLTIEAGQTSSVKLALEPSAELVPVTTPIATRIDKLPRPRWRLGVGTAALGVGTALVGFAVSGLLAGEQCVPVFPSGRLCPSAYLRSGTGAAVSISGALLVAGGVILVALPGARQKVALTPTLLPGGVGGGVGWQF